MNRPTDTSSNGIVVYQGRYSSTKDYAQWIGAALKIPVIDPDRIDAPLFAACSFLVLGTPVYSGGLLLKSWIKKNEAVLAGKTLFIFIVSGLITNDAEKQMTVLSNNIPDAVLSAASVFFLPGRVVHKELSFLDRMTFKMSARLENDPKKRRFYAEDSDQVNEVYIRSLVTAVKKHASQP